MFREKNPDADVIRLGIGDVTLPLGKSVVQAMHAAADEMGNLYPEITKRLLTWYISTMARN